MYFDPAPKEKLEDLYNVRDLFKELKELLSVPVQRNPLIVVEGVRRAGKTSLIKTTLNELGLPYLIIDGRRFAGMPVITRRDFFKGLELDLNEAAKKEKKWQNEIARVLSGVEWIRVDSKFPFFHFEWRRQKPTGMDFLDLVLAFQGIAWENKTRFVLVFDEAQELKRLVDYRLQYPLADIYDNKHEIQMIVSGSQVGLLEDFLEVDNSEAPLFGRGTADITVPRLSRDLAADFLRKGFRQARIENPKAIELAVNELDGVIGWLTLFGRELVMGGSAEDALARTIEKGTKLEAQELEHFLKTRPQARKRYVVILRTAARLRRPARWITLKTNLEAEERKRVPNKIFSALLENLVKADFLKKEGGMYFVPYPLLVMALEKGLVH